MSAVLGAPPFPAELDVHVCRTRTAEAGVPEAGNNPAVQVAVARVVKPQLVRDEVDVIVRGRALYGASCYSRCGLGHWPVPRPSLERPRGPVPAYVRKYVAVLVLRLREPVGSSAKRGHEREGTSTGSTPEPRAGDQEHGPLPRGRGRPT